MTHNMILSFELSFRLAVSFNPPATCCIIDVKLSFQNVCCDDGQHCCPSGTVCDSLTLKCLSASADNSISWIATSSAMSGIVKESSKLKSSDEANGVDAEMLEVAVNHSEEHKPKESIAGVNGYCPDGTVCFGTCCLQSAFPLRYGCCSYVYVST
jgi:Granulin